MGITLRISDKSDCAREKIKADAAIGIVTTASFALGIALISRIRRFTKNLEAISSEISSA